jgi:hypothetical protein
VIDTVRKAAGERGFHVLHRFATSNGFTAQASPVAIRTLLATPGVSIRLDRIFTQQLDVSVPLIDANDLWNRTVNGAPLRGDGEAVCIVDGGIDYNHTAFAGRIAATRCLLSATCPNPADESNASDDQASSHGTHMAGIVAGNGTYTGVAPGARLVVAKVCDVGGNCELSAMVAAIDWCVNVSDQYNISAISMSISDGGYYNTPGDCPYDDGLDGAINAAWLKGIVFAVAAGNGRSSRGIGYPSCNPNATSVSSSTKQDALGVERIGELLKVLAPTDVNTAARGGGYALSGGTSSATPHVAAVAALLAENERRNGRTLVPGLLDNVIIHNGVNVSNWTRVDALMAYLARGNESINVSARSITKLGVGTLRFNKTVDWSEFDKCAVVAHNYISINSATCPQFNTGATLTLTNLTFPGSTSGTPVIYADGKLCTDCVNQSWDSSAGTFVFNVSHFTGYSAGLLTNLTIWDQTDAMPYGSIPATAGGGIAFYANFTNASSLPANATNGACMIDFAAPSYDGYEAMTWDSGKALFTISHIFPTAGTFDWKVNCTGQGENLEANDTITINPPLPITPEFGTIALVAALVLVVGGIVSLRRR